MIVYMVMDGSNFLGYTIGDGQVYNSLDDIPAKRSLFRKTDITVSGDIIYIHGKGLVNLAAERAQRLEEAKRAADIVAFMNRPKSGEVLSKGRK